MHKTYLLLTACGFALATAAQDENIGGTTAPDGKTEIACDLPESLHTKNVGGSDAPDAACSRRSSTPLAGGTSSLAVSQRT